MLVLTRKVGQSIRIGSDVEIMILGQNGNQVRVGISAPIHIPVHREEVYARIQAEQNYGEAL